MTTDERDALLALAYRLDADVIHGKYQRHNGPLRPPTMPVHVLAKRSQLLARAYAAARKRAIVDWCTLRYVLFSPGKCNDGDTVRCCRRNDTR